MHLAGVLDDRLVVNQDPARFVRVLAPKILGALHLHELTRELPLAAFVLFSSTASVFGSAGQSNYAAANAFLDAFAQGRFGLAEGVVFEQASSVDPGTATPPATLSPVHGSTAVGPSGTSATTSSAIRLNGPPTSLLKVVNGPTPLDVHHTVTGRSGFALAADTVTVTLGTASVVVTQSNPLPRSTAVVDLAASSQLTVTAAGVCTGTCTLVMEFRIEPDGAGANPTFVYPYTLTVT